MNNLSIVVAEDSVADAEGVALMIKALRPTWRVVAMTRTDSETLDVVERYQPDFVILDIGLAGPKNGIEIGNEVSHQCPVVFVTGELGHAVDAFELGAVDYIVKPLTLARLEKAFLRMEQLLRNSVLVNPARTGSERGTGVDNARYMQLARGKKLLWTAVSNVRFLQAESGYTRVYLENSSGLIRQALLTVQQRLDRQEFWQIHRGVVINARFVEELERDDMGRLYVRILGYPKIIPVSKNQEKLFKDEFVF